jgi:hypothetical protein
VEAEATANLADRQLGLLVRKALQHINRSLDGLYRHLIVSSPAVAIIATIPITVFVKLPTCQAIKTSEI